MHRFVRTRTYAVWRDLVCSRFFDLVSVLTHQGGGIRFFRFVWARTYAVWYDLVCSDFIDLVRVLTSQGEGIRFSVRLDTNLCSLA